MGLMNRWKVIFPQIYISNLFLDCAIDFEWEDKESSTKSFLGSLFLEGKELKLFLSESMPQGLIPKWLKAEIRDKRRDFTIVIRFNH